MPQMFRLDHLNAGATSPQHARKTRRPPGNVPYILDNLWEWKRPKDYPNRRHSVFVSPTEVLARAAGGAGNGLIYKVNNAFNEEEGFGYVGVVIAQIPQADAKLHPDTGSNGPAKLLMRLLAPEWYNWTAHRKTEIGALWLPCITQGEVDDVFNHPLLRDFREQIWNAITFWDDVRLVEQDQPWPYPEGEGFFQAGRWTLTVIA